MNISNITFAGKEEAVQGSQYNKQKEVSIDNKSIGFMQQPGAFLDEGIEKNPLTGEGLQEKAKSIVQGTTSNHAEFVANSMEETDESVLEEQGISPKDEDVEIMVTVVEKIQLEMAKSGKNNIVTSNLSPEKIKEVVGNGAMAYDMAAQLKSITKEEAAYLINNEMLPTIGNIYQAQCSTYTQKENIPLDNEVKRKVNERVKDYLGEGCTEKDQALAQWMVSAGVEFTKETFQYAKALTEIELPLPQEEVSDIIWAAAQSGNSATEAMLLPGYDLASRAQQGMKVINEATPEQVVYLAENSKEINIKNLAEIQEDNKKLNQEIIFQQDEIKLLKARRMLEETRLYMTAKANLSLLKKGIQLETKPLEELVEALKQQEQEFIKAIYGGNEAGDEIFSAVKEDVRQFSEVPAYCLPRISFSQMTLHQAVSVGKEMAVTLEKANISYETMMTQPRRDLGDNIQKAFRNTEAILDDIGMETTPANERAVRILGYNQMEITREAVEGIKLQDEQVQQLFSNMTPRVVLSMIREGYNPLQVSLEELNRKAEEMHLSLDVNGYESYGKFLVELEQSKDITAAERESYIGIYRLLHQVAQSDGAAIGALVKAEEELTMKNLLTQVRNRKSTGYEKVVDKNVGIHSEDFSADTSITMQIEAAYQTICAKESLRQISVSKLKSAEGSKDIHQMTPEEMLQAFRQAEGTEAEAEVSEYIAKQDQNMMRQSAMADKQVMDMLQHIDMPKSPENILALQQMLTDRNRLFKTLFGEENKRDDLKEALKEIKETLWEDFAEALSAPEDMAKAQEALAETAENIMKDMMEDTEMTSLDIRQLRRMSTQLQIMKSRSKKEEYAVPVLVNDEYGMVSLKIVRGEKEEGKVSIALETPAGEKIAASFSAMKQSLQGYVVSDSEESLGLLREGDDALRESIERHTGIHLEKGSIAYVVSKELSLTQFERGMGDNTEERDSIQTKTLYGVAKGFLQNLTKISL